MGPAEPIRCVASRFVGTDRLRANMWRVFLVWFCVVLAGFQRHVLAAHGDNLLCVGCGVVMEHVYEAVVHFAEERGSSIDMSQRETVEVDFTEQIKEVCTAKKFKSYNPLIQSACVELSTKFSNVVSNVFEGDEPTERMAYDKIQNVCVGILDYCDKPNFMPVAEHRAITNCGKCQAIVVDIMSAMKRKSRWDMYRSKRHVYEELDQACSKIVYRFPNTLTNSLAEICAEIVENYEHELADALMNDFDNAVTRVCGAKITGLCQTKDFQDGALVLQSPFHREPQANVQWFKQSEGDDGEKVGL